LKLACWFWRRRFLKNLSVFLLFCDYLPLEKDNPCQVWLKLVLWFWRRSRKCKSLQTDGRTNGRTDDGQRAIRIAHWSFQLGWAKKVTKYFICSNENSSVHIQQYLPLMMLEKASLIWRKPSPVMLSDISRMNTVQIPPPCSCFLFISKHRKKHIHDCNVNRP
jgi:hypothetical protein